jgi:hypothetical protein
MIDDCLRKIQSIKGLVADGAPASLRKAIEGLNQLHEMIIKDQVTISFDDHCSVDLEFDEDW